MTRARLDSIKAIPHLRVKTACGLHEAAKETIASLKGPVAETMVRTLVDQVRYARKIKCQYEQLLVETYRSLPATNHLDSIPGIGEVTAAVLTAKIISIQRFDRAEQLVGYFGIFPEEKSSGIGKDGLPHPRRNTRMSKKGNDLVRAYLWNACKRSLPNFDRSRKFLTSSQKRPKPFKRLLNKQWERRPARPSSVWFVSWLTRLPTVSKRKNNYLSC